MKMNSKVCEELGQKCLGKSDVLLEEEFSVKENCAKGALTITNADMMVCTVHPDTLNIKQSVRTPADDANN